MKYVTVFAAVVLASAVLWGCSVVCGVPGLGGLPGCPTPTPTSE